MTLPIITPPPVKTQAVERDAATKQLVMHAVWVRWFMTMQNKINEFEQRIYDLENP